MQDDGINREQRHKDEIRQPGFRSQHHVGQGLPVLDLGDLGLKGKPIDRKHEGKADDRGIGYEAMGNLQLEQASEGRENGPETYDEETRPHEPDQPGKNRACVEDPEADRCSARTHAGCCDDDKRKGGNQYRRAEPKTGIGQRRSKAREHGDGLT